MANVFIFHGTGGYPEENWFPWMKAELEKLGHNVFVPQFPTPAGQSVEAWFKILKNYQDKIDGDTIVIGHSLGGLFLLRVLEKLQEPIRLAVSVGTPIGYEPIENYKNDKAFSSFSFDWDKIRKSAENFLVYHSDNDPYVCLENGRQLAQHLGIGLTFVPNAGHFNAKAGYLKFEDLLKQVKIFHEN